MFNKHTLCGADMTCQLGLTSTLVYVGCDTSRSSYDMSCRSDMVGGRMVTILTDTRYRPLGIQTTKSDACTSVADRW